MISRRTVLAGVAAAGAASAQRGASQEPLNIPADSPIGRLKSRRSEAKAITGAERSERLERARRLMHDQKLDAIVIAGGTSLDYFTSIRWGNSERFFGAVIPAKGEPFYISPAFEEDRAREQIAKAPGGKEAKVLVWQEDESPYALLAQGLKDRGLATGKIGVEETMKFVFADGLENAKLHVASATPITAGVRQIKTPAELALMRLASSVTLQAFEAAYRMAHVGMTHTEFGALVSAAHAKLGFPGGGLVLFDENAALPHGTTMPQRAKEGALVLIDGGTTAEGYQSDITRTFVIGKASDKMNRVFDLVHKAQSAALKQARPGVSAESVDAAARKVIVDGGFGPGYKYFTHRVGHGMGMDGHEWPYLVPQNKMPLAPNMTFSDEPGIYIRGEFGVRLEDDMHVTEDGAQLLTPQSHSLEDPFGK
ncbi:MAG: Xaa-Pro peptidase family protein [Bryobacteraceae bacterium]